MGYCMSLVQASFTISAENKWKALAALKELAKQDRKFSWGVDSQRIRQAHSLGEAMDAWRWNIREGGEGNVVRIEFAGEKLGDETILFSTIAPFVKDGSFLELSGEDNSRWRWVFKDGKMEEKHPTVSWE